MNDDMEAKLEELRAGVQEARSAAYAAINEHWESPLASRVRRARALGPLRLLGCERRMTGKQSILHLVFEAPEEDYAAFTAHQTLRLSQDSPAEVFDKVQFIGLERQALAVRPEEQDQKIWEAKQRDGWTLDEDFFDLSQYYFNAIEQMGTTEHGRDRVYAALFGEDESRTNFGQYERVLDEFEELEHQGKDVPDEAQQEAVAQTVAAENFSLVQGPPGTGKTHTLAWTVRALVEQGQRVLVTGFTHRAIHNALSAIDDLLEGACPVFKVSQWIWTEDPESFPIHESFEKSDLSHEGPWVVGATAFCIHSMRLNEVPFDCAVIDETSQMPLLAAIMVMLKTDRWAFFGDPQQLPPVNLLGSDELVSQSAFSLLQKRTDPIFLANSYRMNGEIAHWSSETFYQGRLKSVFEDSCLALKTAPLRYHEVIDPRHSLVRIEVPTTRPTRSHNLLEARLAKGLVETLLATGLEPLEIGVVTPFRAQAALIRKQLSQVLGAERVIVDTVDRFQGQEREVMVISMASSRSNFIERLRTFLLQENRLNVAVTRARTKVLILHSPELRELAEQFEDCCDHAAAFMALVRACSDQSEEGGV